MNVAINLLDYDSAGLTRFCMEIGEKPYRAKQLLRWIHQLGSSDFSEMSDLAKVFREKLAAHAIIQSPEVINDHIAVDGTRKWLLSTGAGNAVEMVLFRKSIGVRYVFPVRLAAPWRAVSVRPADKASIVI
jgi:23S rRNA (adenine2503-C2)-methyltransferase